jgi:hypothetical protein
VSQKMSRLRIILYNMAISTFYIWVPLKKMF